MRRALLAALAGLALGIPAAALDVPYLTGRVNDGARLLDDNSARSLDQTLKDYETRTGRQIVVLTLPSLEGEVLEDFSLKVARTWKLGRQGKDDGILLLVARDDRKARIEVGYGLEGFLPDALSGRIIRDEMVPHFRSGDYAGGITAGVSAIQKALDGTYSPPASPPSRGQPLSEKGPVDKLMIGIMVFSILGLSEYAGLLAPGSGWLLYFFLIPFWAAFPMAIFGAAVGLNILIAHLIGFPILKMIISRTAWGQDIGRRMTSQGGAHIISSSGWSGGGWGGGGGGFSGGGGSFGGGGASGGW